MCRKTYLKKEEDPPCDECISSPPELLDGNRLFLDILNRCSTGRDGISGLPSLGIFLQVIDLYDLENEEKLVLIDKFNVWYSIEADKKKKEQDQEKAKLRSKTRSR